MQRNLQACARRPAIADAWLKLWRQFVWSARRFTGWHASRRRLAAGGLLVAIVGGDGAGKSTQIEELSRWLSDRFEIAKLHLGKPDWSALTVVVRGVLKIGRALGLYGLSELKEEPAPGRSSSDAARLPGMLRAVCTARDRYLAYARARRLADNGDLVICDRYPLLGIIRMDGPQVGRYTGNHRDKWLINLLVALEGTYYRHIAMPDLLIVLVADPDVCVARKTDEEEASVRARSNQIWTFDWKQIQTPVCVIDADRPQAEVFAELQARVWSQL